MSILKIVFLEIIDKSVFDTLLNTVIRGCYFLSNRHLDFYSNLRKFAGCTVKDESEAVFQSNYIL